MKTVFSIIIACLLVALALLTTQAYAGWCYINWNIPTERSNGIPLDISEIAYYELYINGIRRGGNFINTAVTYRFWVPFNAVCPSCDNSLIELYTVDTEDRKSEPSQCPPNPPIICTP